MFLVERILGVALYFMLLLLFFQLIMKKKLRYDVALNCYRLLLSIMAFFYVPYKTADLYRIYEMVNLFGKFKWSDFVERFLFNTSSTIAYTMYWIFGKIGINQLLPAVVCYITYSCIFYIIKNMAKKYELSASVVALGLFFVMSTGNYIMVISNIRTMLALAMIAVCFFRETIMKQFKWWHIPIYIMSIFIHNLAIIVLILRIVVLFFQKKKSTMSYIVFAISALIGFMLVNRYGYFLINSVLEKASWYIKGDSYSYTWDYIIATIALILELMVMKLSKKSYLQVENVKVVKQLLAIATAIALVFVYEFSIYYRFLVCFCPMIVLPLLLTSIEGAQRNKRQYYNVVFIMSCAMLILSCTRGSMSSLKFFEL